MKFSVIVVALSAFTGSVIAVPTYGKPQPQPHQPGSLTSLAKKAPKSDLPAPPAGLVLKFVGLGLGTQNYTCLTGDETVAPGTTGALAKLYDIGAKLNSDPLASWKISSLSGLALSLSSNSMLLDTYLKFSGYEKVLGDHFFTENIPTFALSKVAMSPYPLAYVTKDSAVDAPKSACPGTKSEGALQWLKLSDKDGRSQGGVNTVYRLETAGGNKPVVCKGQKQTFEVPYAAQYWVYGPAS
ncbi:hypothetical protein CC78DRAFT_89080 [Lojkania enalia]|uniref:Malate dehydrogenase n=1 Tax=Lojkania enalia TaxID=147567 RepID=A0A9P4MYX4_9PLEO|nr:hypothetical protein CC78DRAFT_89080 [Didymosphaeria enalia]